MDDSSKPSRWHRLRWPLVGLAAATALVVSLLVLVTRPTVVELTVTARQVELEIVPPVETLLDPAMVARSFEVKGFDCLEATLDGIGRVALRPASGGAVGLQVQEPERARAEIEIHQPLRMTVGVSGKDKLRLELEATDQEGSREAGCGEEGVWSGRISSGQEVAVRLRDVQAAGLDGRLLDPPPGMGPHRSPADASGIAFVGGGRPSFLGLALPPDREAATRLRVLDPVSGEVVRDESLPFTLSEPRTLAWKDRLVLLDPRPAEPWRVLQADLKLRAIELSRRVQLEARSFVVAGKVRFPAGEKQPVDIEPSSFVSLSLDDPLTLRSIALDDGSLALVVWGAPSSLKIGPTPELRRELLPSYLEWLYTHRLVGLVYGVLAWVVGASLALYKLGLFDK